MGKITLLFLLVFFSSFLVAKQEIIVYTYHNHGPFIIENKGLSFDLINYLNQNQNEYNFKLKIIPRKRLNYILEPWINKECVNEKKCHKDWMVLWVNHNWNFGEDSLKNFLWTPLLKDTNIIISSSKNKFEYINPYSLVNRSFAGIDGHRYIGIDDLVEKGLIKRIDGKSEVKNLELLIKQRIDVTILPNSAFIYYKNANSKFKTLYSSKTPQQVYMRNIMTNSYNTKLIKKLDSLRLEELYK